jgi:predicted nucleic-acid-binding protein
VGRFVEQIIDTNIILRFLVGDDKKQQQKAREIFKEAQAGKRKIIIKPLIIAEACFVLESFYKQQRDKIAASFEVILSQKWLTVEDRETMLSLWPWYRKNFHFVDSYLLAWAEINDAEVISFDKKLLRNLDQGGGR